ncbi:hypothetical protein PVAND_012107 [Polypedilum vanderplanki]|uniref:Secreted protein n=1 Tax=Polypedilum vanderplanki TaxID=319348 RepID=A0A9J6CLR1_POLVA|nr:hypothetical protein PVAND_012107 [Polypedilum vanderplanki]
MNYLELLVCLILSYFAHETNSFPQNLKDVAAAVKQTDLHYYYNDALDAIPFENSPHKDNAKEEYEGFGSKALSIYDNTQKKTSDIFKPQPVVDGIKSESEKFGNTGDQLRPLQNVVVSTMSVVSNVVNKILDAPGNAFQFITRNLNVGLNMIGGKLVGLQ